MTLKERIDKLETKLNRIISLVELQGKDCLTTTEAALFLGISPDQMYRLSSGANPEIGFSCPGGKNKYFLKSDLIDYASQNKRFGKKEVEELVNEREK